MLIADRNGMMVEGILPHSESYVQWIEFNGTQWVRLDDITPAYYTYKYTSMDYRLTQIIPATVQAYGTSSFGVTICTGGGYVQSVNTGIPADLDRHIMVFDGVSLTYNCQALYDNVTVMTTGRSSNTERRLTIAAVDGPSGQSSLCYMQFFGMTISDSASAVPEHNFVPYRIDDSGCIKDVVTGKIYYPSAPVMIGPDIAIPSEIGGGG